jgi:hypothetical protein
VLTHNEEKGIDTMGNTDLQGSSKRIRIVLADWSSEHVLKADWSS